MTLLLLLFFLTPILRGEVLSAADLLLKFPPWSAAQPPDFEPANTLLSDDVYQFRPWRGVAIEALREGRLPLWNPHNYAGAPLLGNGITAALYPLNLPFLLLPERPAVLLWAMLRLLVAGFFAYLFGRATGSRPLGAAVTALAFAFSGFLVSWLFWPQVNVAVWLPALFLATEALVSRPAAMRVAGLTAVVWLQFLGGHPQTSLHMLSAATLYATWRIAMRLREERTWGPAGRRLAAFAGGVGLGTAAAAVQLLPLAEYIFQSAALGDRLLAAPSFWAWPGPRVLAMAALACPDCFGSSRRGDIPLGDLLGVGNFNELNGAYVGVITLLLAGAAVALGARRGVDRCFLVLGGLAFCVAYAIPPVFNLVHALPLFRVTSNSRVLVLLAFALAVLAGRGADLLLSAPADRLQPVLGGLRRLVVGAAVGVALVTVVLLVAVIGFREAVLGEARARIAARAEARVYGQGVEHYLARLPDYHDRLVRLLARAGTGRVVLLLLSGVALGLFARRLTGGRPIGWALPAVLVLDLFAFGRGYTPSIPPGLHYPSHDALEFLRAQPGLFRTLALDGALPPNTNLVYGLADVRGYDSLETPAYRMFLAATGAYPQPHRGFRTLYFSNFESPLVDLLNVKYVLSARELQQPKLALVWQGTGTWVYENRAALPRAFLVYRTRVLQDPAAVARALQDPAFEPGAVALLEGAGPVLSGPADAAASATIVSYEPERVVVEVSSRTAGILVLGDAWFPGWRAAVDGVPAEILRADLLLRAVPMPAGHHRVVFRYEPASVRLGLWVSGLGAVGALALVLAGRRSDSGRRPARA